MFQNYFKLALRTLLKSPLFTFLHLSGLALGIASSFVILVYIQQERSGHPHFRGRQRICRVAIVLGIPWRITQYNSG